MRVAREHVARVEREARALGGREGFEQHVGAREQLVQARAAGRRRELERDAALARIAEREAEARAAMEGREAPRTRARLRLDAQHVGAEVREQPPAQLALLVGEIDDAKASERVISGGVGCGHERGSFEDRAF